MHRDELMRCLQLLAAKGAQELVLVNRPTPIRPHLQLLSALLACTASLTRLYLGFWTFPCTLPPAAVFPASRSSASVPSPSANRISPS